MTRLAAESHKELPADFLQGESWTGAAVWFQTLMRQKSVSVSRVVDLTDEEIFVLVRSDVLSLTQDGEAGRSLSVRAFLPEPARERTSVGVPLTQVVALTSSLLELSVAAAAALRAF